MAFALDRRLRLHQIRYFVPVSEATALYRVEKHYLFLGRPALLENWLEKWLKKDEWVGPDVVLGLCADGETFETLIKSRTSRTFHVYFIGDVSVACGARPDVQRGLPRLRTLFFRALV